jgi:O-antigen/teichoic acid export membrane protein
MERGSHEGSTATSAPAAGPVSVDRQMAKGAFWMVLARLLDRSMGLLSIVILARLLVPADFGLLGMATVVLGVIELVGALGFEAALIQNPSAGREHYDTAWTLGVILAIVIAGTQLAIAAPAAWFYNEPRLEALISYLALGTLITGFENIGVIAFRKNLQFNRDFNLTFAKRIVSFAITIPAALILRNYWALVVGQIVGRLVGTILTYVVQEYRPRFSLAARRDLLHFGKWLVITNIMNFVSNRYADFLVGKAAGARQLGLFNLSYEIATLPSSDLITPINRAIFPGYAIKAGDTATLRRSYLDVVSLVAIVVLPAGLGIAATAGLLVPVVLGPAWIDAIPCVSFLAIYGVLLALKATNHYIHIAMGRPWIATFLGTTQIVLLLPLVGFGGLHGGAVGAAIGYVVAQVIFTPISMGILFRALKLRFRALCGAIYRPAIASVCMWAGVRLLAAEWGVNPTEGAALAVSLLSCAAAGALFYVALVYALWRLASRPDGPERHIIDLVQSKLWPQGAGPSSRR